MKIKPHSVTAGILIVVALSCLTIKERLGTNALGAKKSLGLPPLLATYHGKSLKHSSFGFSNVLADLMWVKLLQKASHSPLKPGEVSWEFAQTDAITTLDPNFFRVYDFGAIFLSVFRRDNLGAKIILEKWVRKTPTDWRPQYLLGYHLYFEMQEYEKAAHHILKAAQMRQAPAYLSALGVRLLSQAGGYWQALRLSIELFEQIEDYESRFRLKKRIRALRYELQQQAWNDALATFRKNNRKDPSTLNEVAPILLENNRELASLPLGNISDELSDIMRENFRFIYDPKLKIIRSEKPRKELEIEKVGINAPKTT